jgi:small-conductance mechanosensitive channel
VNAGVGLVTATGRRWWRQAGTVLVLAGIGWHAWAIDLPNAMPRSALAPASAPTAAASQPTADDWRARLEQARMVQQRLAAQSPGSTPLLTERQLTASRLVTLLASQVAAAPDPGAAPEAAPPSPAPVRLAETGPYSTVDVDGLRDKLDDLRAQRAALRISLGSQNTDVEAAIANRGTADAAHNRHRDEANLAIGEATEEQRAQVELAQLRAQIAGLEVLQADSIRQRTQARLAALDEPVLQLEQELARVRSQQRLDGPTLSGKLKELEAESRTLDAELARVERRITERSGSSAATGSMRSLEIEALNGAATALRELQTLARRQMTAWRGRHDYLAGDDKSFDTRRKLDATLSAAIDQVATQQRSVSDRQALLRIEMRADARGANSAEAARVDGQHLREAQQWKLDALHRLDATLHRSAQMLARMREDLALHERPQDMQSWLDRVGALTLDSLGAVWQRELFSATDSTVVDGRVITVDYSVTVGKSVGLMLILVMGYWIAGVVSRALVKLLARRLRLSPAFAQVIRRWLNTILVLAVILVVLRLARIPLTAFAFLGGALAIGVGFGTQNIIKNLISGVIILLERKIQVGDVVTIGGMSGTVMLVDFRATTVRGFDGVDAIVPNSLLLESQISNWSGGDPNVRRQFDIGVAYGSDVRHAAALVTTCARAHAAVLSSPAPEVLLNDFGNDALVLRLLYWTHLGGERGGPGIDSDLRFAIEQQLREAGIGIAYPQRDVHLDLAGPVRVALVQTGDAAPTPSSSPPGQQPAP